jgi:hypothetical protein
MRFGKGSCGRMAAALKSVSWTGGLKGRAFDCLFERVYGCWGLGVYSCRLSPPALSMFVLPCGTLSYSVLWHPSCPLHLRCFLLVPLCRLRAEGCTLKHGQP